MNNFTPRAQQVLALARKEADRFNHNYVGTEHLLLGLIKLGQGVAVNVLQKMNLDLETVRLEVEKQVGNGPETKMVGNIPAEQAGLRIKAIVGGAGADRSLAIQQLVVAASQQFAPSDIAVISMLEDPSSALGRFCHEHDIANYMAPDTAALKKALSTVKS